MDPEFHQKVWSKLTEELKHRYLKETRYFKLEPSKELQAEISALDTACEKSTTAEHGGAGNEETKSD
jgi:hypothetical protein